jgi:hypothetical protein
LIQPGKYQGKIVDYRIQKTKKEEPEPNIEFKVKDLQGNFSKIFWRGSLNNETGIEITLKALMACGLQNPDDIYKMADGVKSGVLDTDKILSVTVVHETYNGNTKAIVKWVNDPEEEAARAAEYSMDANTAKKMLGSIGLRGRFNAIKSGESTKSAQPNQMKHSSLDDIPF